MNILSMLVLLGKLKPFLNQVFAIGSFPWLTIFIQNRFIQKYFPSASKNHIKLLTRFTVHQLFGNIVDLFIVAFRFENISICFPVSICRMCVNSRRASLRCCVLWMKRYKLSYKWNGYVYVWTIYIHTSIVGDESNRLARFSGPLCDWWCMCALVQVSLTIRWFYTCIHSSRFIIGFDAA